MKALLGARAELQVHESGGVNGIAKGSGDMYVRV